MNSVNNARVSSGMLQGEAAGGAASGAREGAATAPFATASTAAVVEGAEHCTLAAAAAAAAAVAPAEAGADVAVAVGDDAVVEAAFGAGRSEAVDAAAAAETDSAGSPRTEGEAEEIRTSSQNLFRETLIFLQSFPITAARVRSVT